MPDSPTSRTLRVLRQTGHLAAVVERRLPRGFRSVDLFGAFDVLAIKGDVPGVLGVQCTSSPHLSDRVKKLLGNPALEVWLLAGNSAEVWGWAKRGPAGTRKLWTLSRRVLTLTPAGVEEVKEDRDVEAE